MYLAYFDESGDSGLKNSPTKYFVLACVIVHETKWLEALNALISLRARLKDRYGIKARPEIKSTDLRRGRGALLGLKTAPAARMRLFRGLMRYQRQFVPGLTVFAVAIEKDGANARGFDSRERAWEFALQRLERFCGSTGERAMIFPDEGHGAFIKRLLRKKRRHSAVPRRLGGGVFQLPMSSIVEDPNDRQSHDSYFIQLADWAAYAAHRSSYIDPVSGFDADTWDQLGDIRLLKVNMLAGGPPGIKVYP